MKNKTCPFQDWVLTQGTNSAENEHDETDPRTCPDWLRMSINKTDAHPQVPASTRTGRVMITRSPSQVSGADYKHQTVIMKKKFTLCPTRARWYVRRVSRQAETCLTKIQVSINLWKNYCTSVALPVPGDVKVPLSSRMAATRSFNY